MLTDGQKINQQAISEVGYTNANMVNITSWCNQLFYMTTDTEEPSRKKLVEAINYALGQVTNNVTALTNFVNAYKDQQ